MKKNPLNYKLTFLVLLLGFLMINPIKSFAEYRCCIPNKDDTCLNCPNKKVKCSGGYPTCEDIPGPTEPPPGCNKSCASNCPYCGCDSCTGSCDYTCDDNDNPGGGGGGGGGGALTPTVTQNPASTPTPAPLAPPTNLSYSCSGWSVTFNWTKSTDTRVDSYAVRANKNNGWANATNNPIWFMPDGSDKFIRTSNVNNVSTIIIPMRQYYDWSVQSTNATNRNLNPASTNLGTAFTCIPNYTLPTGASCRQSDSSLNPDCTIDYFKSQYNKQYGYSIGAQTTILNPNLVTGRNAYKAILTETSKTELIDLLDFEEWRRLKNSVPIPATPTPTSILIPTATATPTSIPIPTATPVPPTPTSIITPVSSITPTTIPPAI